MAAWPFDRRERIAVLIERARSLENYLVRQRFDLPPGDRAGRAALDARRAIVAGRLRGLYTAYRRAHRRPAALAG